MTVRVQKEIAEIKNLLLQMSAIVEESVRTSILAWQQRNPDLAQRVIDHDWEIDDMENKIDTLCLKTLALQQPMAADLRFLTSAMQIAEQLERVGDHAVNISEKVYELAEEYDTLTITASPKLKEMAKFALSMLADSINSFVYNDSLLAWEVRRRDKVVDELYSQVLHDEIHAIEASKREIRAGVSHIILALNIERIADLATNIAEDVIFYVEGKMVRHIEKETTSSHREDSPSHPADSPEDKGSHAVHDAPSYTHSERISSEEAEIGQKTPYYAPIKGDIDTVKDSYASICVSKEAEHKKREPLECLENHAKYVADCFEEAKIALAAYFDKDIKRFEVNAKNVTDLEHAADLISRNVRAHLPKGIIMPIDKFELFLYLQEEDNIADTAEDIVEWLSYRMPDVGDEIKEAILDLCAKCLVICKDLKPIIHAARTYFQTGDEDVRMHIKDKILALRTQEHEADIMEHRLKGFIFKEITQPIDTIYLLKLVELIGRAADHAENAADILRSMIAK